MCQASFCCVPAGVTRRRRAPRAKARAPSAKSLPSSHTQTPERFKRPLSEQPYLLTPPLLSVLAFLPQPAAKRPHRAPKSDAQPLVETVFFAHASPRRSCPLSPALRYGAHCAWRASHLLAAGHGAGRGAAARRRGRGTSAKESWEAHCTRRPRLFGPRALRDRARGLAPDGSLGWVSATRCDRDARATQPRVAE